MLYLLLALLLIRITYNQCDTAITPPLEVTHLSNTHGSSPSVQIESLALNQFRHYQEIIAFNQRHPNFIGPMTQHSFIGPMTHHSFIGPMTHHIFIGPTTHYSFIGPTSHYSFIGPMTHRRFLGPTTQPYFINSMFQPHFTSLNLFSSRFYCVHVP